MSKSKLSSPFNYHNQTARPIYEKIQNQVKP